MEIVNSQKNNITIEHEYTVEGYATFSIFVKSNFFAGQTSFCLPNELIRTYIDSLTLMHDTLSGSCKIRDADSDSFLEITMLRHGHAEISGQIGGSHEDHFMRFHFYIDQTVIDNFIKIFKEISSNPKDVKLYLNK